MKIIILLSVFVGATLTAPSDVDDSLQLLSVANSQFAASVYKEIQKTDKGHLIFSPFSAETILALTSDGARGDTRKELLAALHLPESQQKIQQGFKEILPKLTINTENVKLLSANKLYVTKKYKLNEDFQKSAIEIYNSDIENINFEKNKEAAGIINKWVEEQTNNKIKDLANPEDLNEDTVLVLINALYLSANWLDPFYSFNTHDEKFYKTAKDTIDLPIMQQRGFFKFYNNKELNAKFLELRYEGEGLSAVFVLPNEKEGLADVEVNLEHVFEPQPLATEDVDVKLPKFTINSEIKFIDILKNLGVNKLFNDADLSGLFNRSGISVSQVFQKAFINVTESGTEAAAATEVIAADRSQRLHSSEPKEFHADHSFIYLIKYHEVILFAGKFNP